MLADLLSMVQSIVMKPNLEDNRSRPRARCHVPVSCQTPNGAVVCTLKDISTHGARVLTDVKMSKNSDVLLLPPKGSSEKDKPVKCKAVWSRRYHGEYFVGLKFRAPNSENWVKALLRELGMSLTVPTQRRKFVRFPTEMRVKLRMFNKSVDTKLLDLSMGGALVEVPSTISSESKVTLDLPTHRKASSVNLPCIATKTRSSKDGKLHCSLQFESLASEERGKLVKHLNALFRQNH